MAYDPNRAHDPVDPRDDAPTGWTGFAALKYALVYLIVVALLYVAIVYASPALTD